jgi:hypothetical protein
MSLDAAKNRTALDMVGQVMHMFSIALQILSTVNSELDERDLYNLSLLLKPVYYLMLYVMAELSCTHLSYRPFLIIKHALHIKTNKF